ncbi:hypothetical protein KY284_022326 [Solanum tuberosum]|nr:hypothetical protein KY284_022326 [Solanum tuberosum]
MAPVNRKIVLTKETTDTKIQKRPRTKTCRKKNENLTITLLEELASEAVSSSQPNATGDSIMRMGKSFDTFRITLKQNENNNARFQMIMVYELLKRRVKCHPPSESVPEFIVKEEPRRRKKGGKEETRQSTEEQDLVSLVGTSFKNPDLIYMLNVEDTSRKHKESLCLLWFVHNVILAKDLNNNISLKWVNLSQDIEAFNNYPWGHESFELTIKYLLKPLGQKTNNLFGFPLVFMTWTFEAIPHLTHQVNAEEEISSPRILRWLRLKTKTAKNIPDLYNPPHDAVVHPWLVPTEKELQMSYLITLGLFETLFDPVVDRVKMELAGTKTIKRDRVVNEFVIFDGVDGHGIDAGAGQDQGDTSCRRCFGFLCEKCKKQDEDYIIEEVKVIPSKNVRHPYTSQTKRRKKSFIKALQNLKKKIFGELPMAVGEEVLEFKHVNVYKRVTIAEKNKLVDLTRVKELRAQYDMHFFSGEDFRTMTSMHIWWEDWYVDEILSLMWERHVRYPEYYDFTDRILDLNFYSNFKLRYDKMCKEATKVGGRSFTQLINEFEWDEDMINYVRGIRLYPGGMDWIGAKRLLAVMNMNKTHFVTLEIL